MKTVWLIFASQMKGSGERLLGVLKQRFPNARLDHCRSIGELSRRLRQSTLDVTVAVLLVSSKEELLEITALRDFLRDMKIILIVPDSDPDTLLKGYRLKPKFLCDAGGDFMEVVAVLGWMDKGTAAPMADARSRRQRAFTAIKEDAT